MGPKRFEIIVCLVFILLAALTGCDRGAESEKSSASLTESPTKGKDWGEPQTGDRIILGTIGEPSNLIPQLSSDSSSHEVASNIYVAPLKYDKDIKLIPWAAESYEVKDDGRKLIFHMRKDIRWTDGVPLTAEDVAFTYKMMIDPKTPTAYAEDYKNITRFRLVDKYTFEVDYDRPFARSLVTWALEILPKHLLEGQDLTRTPLTRNPVGAGPYMLKEWKAGTSLTLVANPDYFEGRPYLDEVVYRIIPDQSTMFLEVKAGNLDMMSLTPQQYLHQTTGDKWDQAYRKFKYLAFNYVYMGYNLSNPLFQDKRVRQALAYAVDKNEIIKGALLGEGVPTVGPYKPGTWAYNDKIADYPYDPAKAQALLAEAGWRDRNAEGVLVKDGRPFEFTILTNQGNDVRIKTATIIQNRLKAVGIVVKIRTVEWAAFIKEFIDKGKFDATILAWTITQDPDAFNVWHSSRAVPGGLNFTGFRNAEVDKLLVEARHTLDQAKRKALYDRFQEILHEEQPYLFLYTPNALPIIASRFQGIEPAPAGITHNFIRWWTPKELRRSQPTP